MQSNAITPLDEPVKYRTVHDVGLALDDLLPESEFSPAQLSRIAAVAREKHVDRRAQVVAVLDAAAQEVAAHPRAEDSPALKALDQFRAEFDPKVVIEAGAPRPWLEERRPRWSDPDHDIVTEPLRWADAWLSQPLVVTMSTHYFGRTRADGGQDMPQVSATLVQRVTDREPHIAVDPLAWYAGGDSLRDRSFSLRLDEAAALARALLLLVDAAHEEV